ncbi:hypothetical protein LINPERHAP1_LOCUS41433 [Linum perenne]
MLSYPSLNSLLSQSSFFCVLIYSSGVAAPAAVSPARSTMIASLNHISSSSCPLLVFRRRECNLMICVSDVMQELSFTVMRWRSLVFWRCSVQCQRNFG